MAIKDEKLLEQLANGFEKQNTIAASLGGMLMQFQDLESMLKLLVRDLLGVETKVAECVTAQVAFKNLIPLVKSLFALIEEKYGERKPGLRAKLDEVCSQANLNEADRNKYVHSKWGLDVNFNPVRDKITTAKGILKNGGGSATADEIEALTKRIVKTMNELQSFWASFMACYR